MLNRIKNVVLKFIEDNFKVYRGDRYWVRNYSNGDVVNIHVYFVRIGKRRIRIDIYIDEIDGETGRNTEYYLEDAGFSQFGGQVIEIMKGTPDMESVNKFWEEHIEAVYPGAYY